MRFCTIAMACLAVSSATALAQESGNEPAQGDSARDKLVELFAESLHQIEQNYFQKTDHRELVNAAIAGMLSKLDQHSSYITPHELETFNRDGDDRVGGIGVHLMIENERLTVVSPIANSPAHRAKLSGGDVITHIDGDPTAGRSLSDAVQQLKGPLGTTVNLTIHPADRPGPVSAIITREQVAVRTVRGHSQRPDGTWDYFLDDHRGIGYVRIGSFAPNTVRELRAVMDELTLCRLEGLVLDLRSNPGGLLTSAVEVSDMFVEEGTIVTTQGRHVETRRWKAHKAGTYSGFPMVVIVNRFSASGSEIVAACLQDHGRAVVAGQRTWGKGTVQNVLQLEDGRSAMKLTTAEYYRPNGRTIDRKPDASSTDFWGVSPDEGLERVMSDSDTALLYHERETNDLDRRNASVTDVLKDPQLDLAVRVLVGKVEAKSP